jgi:hypothetical protein
MGFNFKLGPIGFGSDDTAEYNYKAIKDSNETSTRNLKLQLAAQQQSEMRWMNFQEDQNESMLAQLNPQRGGGCILESLAELANPIGCLSNPLSVLSGLF